MSKSLYLVKFQPFFERKPPFAHKNFLQKPMRKSRCYKCKICCTLFPANSAVEQEIIMAANMIAIFIFTRF